MTKLEIINETLEWYKTHPRSMKGDNCMYKGENGAECAFQRVVENDLSEWEYKNCNDIPIEIQFKPGYEGHDIAFWMEVQKIHDRFMNDEGNITPAAQLLLDKLIQKYS